MSNSRKHTCINIKENYNITCKWITSHEARSEFVYYEILKPGSTMCQREFEKGFNRASKFLISNSMNFVSEAYIVSLAWLVFPKVFNSTLQITRSININIQFHYSVRHAKIFIRFRYPFPLSLFVPDKRSNKFDGIFASGRRIYILNVCVEPGRESPSVYSNITLWHEPLLPPFIFSTLFSRLTESSESMLIQLSVILNRC